MGVHKKIFLVLLFTFFIIGIAGYVLAANENITYKAEYESSTTYKLTITGLEPEEGYDYYAMICQETDITGSDFLSSGGKWFGIDYDVNTNTWEGNTLGAHDGLTKLYGAFEKTGQYYVYIARHSASQGLDYEIIDGPTEIETPDLPPLGERISIGTFSYSSTRYSIKVNARNTMFYNGVQRTINFYVGEVTDSELLTKLSNGEQGAYDELMKYAKQQVPNLKQDSFQDTTSGVLDYNIVADYPIEEGKYYFLYSILDNENGTYNDVEDIEIYNGDVSSSGEVRLTSFKYENSQNSGESNQNSNSGQTNTNIVENQNSIQRPTNDNTTAGVRLPNAGNSLIAIVVLVIGIALIVIFYAKNKKYEGIK